MLVPVICIDLTRHHPVRLTVMILQCTSRLEQWKWVFCGPVAFSSSLETRPQARLRLWLRQWHCVHRVTQGELSLQALAFSPLSFTFCSFNTGFLCVALAILELTL